MCSLHPAQLSLTPLTSGGGEITGSSGEHGEDPSITVAAMDGGDEGNENYAEADALLQRQQLYCRTSCPANGLVGYPIHNKKCTETKLNIVGRTSCRANGLVRVSNTQQKMHRDKTQQGILLLQYITFVANMFAITILTV